MSLHKTVDTQAYRVSQSILLVDLDKAIKQLMSISYDQSLAAHRENPTKIYRKNPWRKVLKLYRQIDLSFVNQSIDLSVVPPYCRLLFFVDASKKLYRSLKEAYLVDSKRSIYNNEEQMHYLKVVFDNLRKQRMASWFKAFIRTYQRQEKDNFNSARTYVNRLFLKHSRLLVVRVDLGYYKEQRVCYQQFCDDFERFVQLIPCNPAFTDKVGYLWKIEYGLKKGYHVHLLVFYNGAKRREDASIGRMIGELWQKVTPTRGMYFNCNTLDYKKKLNRSTLSCLGRVERNEQDKIKHLIDHALAYLVKIDPYLKLIKMDSSRITGRGQMPAGLRLD